MGEGKPRALIISTGPWRGLVLHCGETFFPWNLWSGGSLNGDCPVVVTHQDSTAQGQISRNQGVKLPSGPLPDLEKRLWRLSAKLPGIHLPFAHLNSFVNVSLASSGLKVPAQKCFDLWISVRLIISRMTRTWAAQIILQNSYSPYWASPLIWFLVQNSPWCSQSTSSAVGCRVQLHLFSHTPSWLFRNKFAMPHTLRCFFDSLWSSQNARKHF